MALRFRQTFTLFPGVRLNVSKGGISTTIGVSGASLNVGPKGVRATIGVPGTGFSYSTKVFPAPESPSLGSDSQSIPADYNTPSNAKVYIPVQGMREIGSASVEVLTSSSLVELRDMFSKAREQERAIREDLQDAEAELTKLSDEADRRKRSIFRFFYKKRIAQLAELVPQTHSEVDRLKEWATNTKISVEFETTDDAQRAYASLVRAFEALRSCRKIWDITSDRDTNRFVERTVAERTVARHPVSFAFSTNDLIQFPGRALHFENFNGEDILIYPALAVMPRPDGMFALIDLRELTVIGERFGFHETEMVHSDTKTIGQTWAKTNKDGSPDRRFKDNYSIPVVEYGHLIFRSASGLTEEYQVSKADTVIAFAAALSAYQQAL